MGVKYSEVIERMRWAGKLKNDSAVARAVGVTPQALSSCKKRGEMPSNLVLKFSRLFDLSVDWLITGEGVVHKPHKGSGDGGAPEQPAFKRAFPAKREKIGFTVLNADEVEYVDRLVKVLRAGNPDNAAALKNTIDALVSKPDALDKAANS
jgi:CI repressor-like protein